MPPLSNGRLLILWRVVFHVTPETVMARLYGLRPDIGRLSTMA